MNESFVPSIDSLTTGNPSGKVNTAPQLADESLWSPVPIGSARQQHKPDD